MTTHELDALADLLATAARHVERCADAAIPGSREYLEHIDIARQCADAADELCDAAAMLNDEHEGQP